MSVRAWRVSVLQVCCAVSCSVCKCVRACVCARVLLTWQACEWQASVQQSRDGGIDASGEELQGGERGEKV